MQTTPSSSSNTTTSMEIESAKCECCGLREDCTQEYITGVKANFDGKWLCGLCAEAVRDEETRGRWSGSKALDAHISFCRKFRSNPAVRVADGMRQMLRRRSGDLATARRPATVVPATKFGRSVSAAKTEGGSSVSLY